MALKACPECRKDVASDAERCPHCGKLQKAVSGFRVLVLLLVVVAVGWLLFGVVL